MWPRSIRRSRPTFAPSSNQINPVSHLHARNMVGPWTPWRFQWRCARLRLARQSQMVRRQPVCIAHVKAKILDRLSAAMTECWLQCHLMLLPKPHKSTRRPENLQPLGIQDVAAKTFSRVIRGRLFEEVHSKILSFPQFAYLAGRSTEDAIHRIVEHCRTVRLIHSQSTGTVYTKKAVGHPYLVVLNWPWTCPLPSIRSLACTFIMPWHGLAQPPKPFRTSSCYTSDVSTSQYIIEHGPYSGSLAMKRGVKQGCSLAPMLLGHIQCLYNTSHRTRHGL